MILFNTSCASYLVMQNSKSRIDKKDQVIKASATDDGVFIGIDILNLRVLKEQPLLQLGAGLLDALMVYSTYKEFGGSENNSGRNIIITGDKNDVTFTGDDNSIDVDYNKD